MSVIAPWVALALMCAAFAAALGALLARALFVMCMYLIAAGALAAGALALLYGGGAAGIALMFAGIAPVALLGLVLLSVRTTKAQRRARPWLSVGAAGAVALVVLWSTSELGVMAPVEAPPPEAIGAWIAPIVFVAVAAFVGLLGYGERGALQRNAMDGELKPGAHIMISATARLYAPLIVLFALSLLAGAPSGSGVGFVAGLAAGLALLLHALVFGATASARAFPPRVSRVFVALGLVAASVGAGVPGLVFAPRIVEAGAFLLTLGACALVIVALFGRAPTLRDGEW